MSGGHSLSKGLEAGRRDLWQECRERGRGGWARGQRGQRVACSPVSGFSQATCARPKAKPVQEGWEVQ